MTTTKKHPTLAWEVSIVELHSEEKVFYKVTRRLPAMNVSETKVFFTLTEAKFQFEEWLK